MKKDLRAPVIALLITATLSACSGPDDSPPPVPIANESTTVQEPRTGDATTDTADANQTETGTEMWGEDPKPDVPRTLRGILTIGFERSVIQLDGSSSLYWAKGPLNTIKIEEPSRIQDHKFRVEIEGTVSKRGQYGHMGAYEREVRITKIVSSRPVP